jgi:hypothetical protein
MSHDACPERARQADPNLSPIQKIGGQVCDCAHVILDPPDITPDPPTFRDVTAGHLGD